MSTPTKDWQFAWSQRAGIFTKSFFFLLPSWYTIRRVWLPFLMADEENEDDKFQKTLTFPDRGSESLQDKHSMSKVSYQTNISWGILLDLPMIFVE